MLIENKKNFIAKSLKLIKQCPSCQASYVAQKVEVLQANDYGVLVYFNCQVCSSSLIATITEMPFGVIGSAMLTDLSAPEITKFFNQPEINDDDVLEVYQELEKINVSKN